MSKTKKKSVEPSTTISILDIKFVKIIEFTGVFFLIALGAFLGAWVIIDSLLEITELKLDAVSFTFIIVTGTNGALCFAISTKINKNLDQKKEIFIDWLKAELLFSLIAIIAVAAYQW